jgi:hypothetical protein
MPFKALGDRCAILKYVSFVFCYFLGKKKTETEKMTTDDNIKRSC